MSETKLMRAIEMMIKTDKMHRFMIDSRVKQIGIHRTQHRILMHLARDGMLPSQKELAERLEISDRAVSKWEMGRSLPSLNNMIEIAGIFGVPIDFFFHTREDEAKRAAKPEKHPG